MATGKVIFYYDSFDGYDMLNRCFIQYRDTRNAKRHGVTSIIIYANDTMTAYFKRSKSGTITAKVWLTEDVK